MERAKAETDPIKEFILSPSGEEKIDFKSPIDELFDIAKLLLDESMWLRGKASAFISTGNERMGEDLHNLAQVLLEASDRIGQSTSKISSSVCEQSFANTINVFKGVLAGTYVNEGGNDGE